VITNKSVDFFAPKYKTANYETNNGSQENQGNQNDNSKDKENNSEDNGKDNSSSDNGNGNNNSSNEEKDNSDKGNGNDNDNGKDKEKENDNGKHNGWDKNTDKGSDNKGKNGLHLGWYKRADHPKNPANTGDLNNPTAYEIINYINDVSLNNAEVLMTSDREGKYNTAYTYGLERISVDNLKVEDSFKEEPLFYLYDGRGNTTELTDNRGVARDRYRYDPYGAPIPKATIGPNPWYTDNPYRYNGEDYDINSGLQYLRARYYEPNTGRFLSRDSYLGDIADPLTQNRYIYALNNPIKYSDPSGHRVIMDDGEYYYPEKTDVSYDSELIDYQESDELIVDKIVGNKTWASQATEKTISNNRNNCDDLEYVGNASSGSNDITDGDARIIARILAKNPEVALGVILGIISVAVSDPVTVGETPEKERAAIEEAKRNEGGSKASSVILRQNMIKAGIEEPEYANAAHHIVAGTSQKANEARAILQKYGIDINDATNGVFLPTVKDVPNSTYHPSLHTNAYYDKVNDMLRGATSKDDVLDILSDISEQLLNGTFMK